MKQITDFGRKRTHVQAGFPDDSEPVEEPAESHASTSIIVLALLQAETTRKGLESPD
ncbi:hypothetical protein BDR07DRAFT_1480359 [Suillus spraguei]|nr:hypothetical protein BDR07DRAFT_1480359 [Suillus spraguei]